MAFGLLILRVVIGAFFVGHGTQKLFGWFDGPGLDGASGMFGSLGYRKPRAMAVLAGASEAGAGVLLVLGLLTPLASAAIIGVMLNAIVTVHAGNGPWVSDGGWEYNVMLATAAAAFAFTGAGAFSIEQLIGWDLSGGGWGIGAILVGLASGAAVVAARETRTTATAEAPSDEAPEERREAA